MRFVLPIAILFFSAVRCPAAEEFVWNGDSAGTELKTASRVFAVEPGKTVRFDIIWTKRDWNFGSAARVRIIWERASGEQIAVTALNSALTAVPGAANYPCVEGETKSALGKQISVRAYQVVPANAAGAKVAFLFYGNPCRIALDSVSVTAVDPTKKPWMRRQPKRDRIEYGPQPYSDADVVAALASRQRALPRLVRDGDRVELEVNGERVFPALRHVNRRDPMHGVREFSKIGFRIFNTLLYVGEPTYKGEKGFNETQILREDGTYDIALMERKVHEVLREDTNAYVVLVCKISATEAWKRANPEELERDADGRFRVFARWKFSDTYSRTYPSKPGFGPVPSVFSDRFPRDISVPFAEALRRFEKTDASKAVIGVYVTGGDDSQFRLQKDPWTSAMAPAAFRSFLKRKYGGDAALAAAWGTPGAKIADAEVPSAGELYPDSERLGTRPSRASDFREFCSDAVARMNASFRAAVKAGAPRLLAGGYSCATTLGSGDGRGRYALAAMMNDPGTDFIVWLPGYSRCRDEIVLPLGLGAYNGSMLLRGKLMIAEMDVRYPYGAYLQSGIYKSDRWQETHDDGTFSDFTGYFAAASFAWGGTFHAFPLSYNWYDYPEAMAAWKRASDIVRRAKGRPLDGNRIAAIYDDRSTDFVSWNMASYGPRCHSARNRQTANALWRTGVRFDQYALEDVLTDAFSRTAPKVLLLNDATTLSPERIRAIRGRYGKDKRVLLWVGNTGFHSGAPVEAVAEEFGLGISPDDSRMPVRASGNDDPLCREVEGFWNETCSGVARGFPMSYALECRNGWKPLAVFAGTRRCAAAVRRRGSFTEIVVGAPGSVTPRFLRNVCREAGFEPVLESDDFYIEGGGLMVIGGCVRDGVRTLRLPPGVKRIECLTGQTVRYPCPGFAEVEIDCGKAAVFAWRFPIFSGMKITAPP